MVLLRTKSTVLLVFLGDDFPGYSCTWSDSMYMFMSVHGVVGGSVSAVDTVFRLLLCEGGLGPCLSYRCLVLPFIVVDYGGMAGFAGSDASSAVLAFPLCSLDCRQAQEVLLMGTSGRLHTFLRDVTSDPEAILSYLDFLITCPWISWKVSLNSVCSTSSCASFAFPHGRL